MVFNHEQISEKVELLLDETISFIQTSSWRDQYLLGLKALQEELHAPCVLAIAGKVKAGKSMLVNALLGMDLAATGVTETTATINIFKSGTPKSPDTPILCCWLDGTKEWVSKSFLDQLQGADEKTLSLTAKIDRLVYYVEGNSQLEGITLVDTPGIGAVTGEDGEAHQIQTDAYFKLRQRHSEETMSLSNNADAVLYLFKDNPAEEVDAEFLKSVNEESKGLSAINSIGILSKIDMRPTLIEHISKYKSFYEKELFTIVPTSAAIARYLPSCEEAIRIQNQLKNGFDSREDFDRAICMERSFKLPLLAGCTITAENRLKMMRLGGDEVVPWSAFKLIIKCLYDAKDVQAALDELKRIAGITPLKELIHTHFFGRRKLLRCHSVLGTLTKILREIEYDKYFTHADYYAKQREGCLRECQRLSVPYREIIEDLIKQYLDSKDKVDIKYNQLRALICKTETISSELEALNNGYLAYQLFLQNQNVFTDAERQELDSLFTDRLPMGKYGQRIQYWNGVSNAAMNMATYNTPRYSIAVAAKNKYMTLNMKNI